MLQLKVCWTNGDNMQDKRKYFFIYLKIMVLNASVKSYMGPIDS